jgi:hypothetical protein
MIAALHQKALDFGLPIPIMKFVMHCNMALPENGKRTEVSPDRRSQTGE